MLSDDSNFKRSVELDGNTRSNHFKNYAIATKDIPPNLYCNFAGPEAEISKLEEEGKLNLKAYCDSDAHVDSDIRSCCSMHCARTEAPAWEEEKDKSIKMSGGWGVKF